MIHNRVEEHAREAYHRMVTHFPAFCGCDLCQGDVLVYALNRLPARYVASREGTVITELSLDKQQNKVSIDVVVMDAIRKVAFAPRCGKVEPQRL